MSQLSGKKRRRSSGGNWIVETWNKLWNISSPQTQQETKKKRKRKQQAKQKPAPAEGRRISSTPKPQEIETQSRFDDEDFSDAFDLPSRASHTQENTPGDLFSALDRKIKHGLTPEEQKRLLSSVQKISPSKQPLLPQTPTQTPRSTVISTPQFRLTTPIRPYTAPIQQTPISPQVTVKRPVPVYSPITPTQHIKQTAFRSARRSQTPAKQRARRHSLKLQTNLTPSPADRNSSLQMNISEQQGYNEVRVTQNGDNIFINNSLKPPRKKRLYVPDVLDTYSKPSYALEVAIGIFDAIDKISSPLVPAKSSSEEAIREKYIQARAKQTEEQYLPPVNDLSNENTATEPFSNVQASITRPTRSRTRSNRESAPYSRKTNGKTNRDEQGEESEEDIVHLPKKDEKQFSFSTTPCFVENKEFATPITPDCFSNPYSPMFEAQEYSYTGKSDDNLYPTLEKQPPSLDGFAATGSTIEAYSPHLRTNPHTPISFGTTNDNEDEYSSNEESYGSGSGSEKRELQTNSSNSNENPFASALSPGFLAKVGSPSSEVIFGGSGTSSDEEMHVSPIVTPDIPSSFSPSDDTETNQKNKSPGHSELPSGEETNSVSPASIFGSDEISSLKSTPKVTITDVESDEMSSDDTKTSELPLLPATFGGVTFGANPSSKPSFSIASTFATDTMFGANTSNEENQKQEKSINSPDTDVPKKKDISLDTTSPDITPASSENKEATSPTTNSFSFGCQDSVAVSFNIPTTFSTSTSFGSSEEPKTAAETETETKTNSIPSAADVPTYETKNDPKPSKDKSDEKTTNTFQFGCADSSKVSFGDIPTSFDSVTFGVSSEPTKTSQDQSDEKETDNNQNFQFGCADSSKVSFGNIPASFGSVTFGKTSNTTEEIPQDSETKEDDEKPTEQEETEKESKNASFDTVTTSTVEKPNSPVEKSSSSFPIKFGSSGDSKFSFSSIPSTFAASTTFGTSITNETTTESKETTESSQDEEKPKTEETAIVSTTTSETITKPDSKFNFYVGTNNEKAETNGTEKQEKIFGASLNSNPFSFSTGAKPFSFGGSSNQSSTEDDKEAKTFSFGSNSKDEPAAPFGSSGHSAGLFSFGTVGPNEATSIPFGTKLDSTPTPSFSFGTINTTNTTTNPFSFVMKPKEDDETEQK